ncbi:DNA-binding protein [Salmonella enterica]|nr:DNA-binding protein [Salmonella enterica]ELU6954391.1 DNA-binding protein [Salmonella enterica]
MPNCIPLNPKLPANFDITPNEERSKAQLDAWWDHPYCVTYNGKFLVYCLNGGAWDRPTMLGQADTYDEACELAEEKQAKWVKTRAQPTFLYSTEPPFILIRQPQRPDHQQVIVGEFATIEEMNLFSLAQEQNETVEVVPTLNHNHMNLPQLAWYSNALEMSISKLGNEANALSELREFVIKRIREVQNG